MMRRRSRSFGVPAGVLLAITPILEYICSELQATGTNQRSSSDNGNLSFLIVDQPSSEQASTMAWSTGHAGEREVDWSTQVFDHISTYTPEDAPQLCLRSLHPASCTWIDAQHEDDCHLPLCARRSPKHLCLGRLGP